MNYQKLDAALAIALNDVADQITPSLTVFIHTEKLSDSAMSNDKKQSFYAILQSFGVSDVNSSKDIFTATLSANAIAQLSEQPWVTHLQLSQQLRLVNQGRKLGSFKV